MARNKKLPPIHPGEMLREEFLVPLKMKPEELAIERDHNKDIDKWYKGQLDSESAKKRNDLWNMILELKWNIRQQDQENKELKKV